MKMKKRAVTRVLFLAAAQKTKLHVSAFVAPRLASGSTCRGIDSSLKSTLVETIRVAPSIEPFSPVTPSPVDKKYWEIGPTMMYSKARPLTAELLTALETQSHPTGESQDKLGYGTFITRDWRRAWHTYESPPDNPDLIDPNTGFAEYVVDDIEGSVPHDLEGVLYRNGPGQFGVDGERVSHVLDANGLIISITIPPPNGSKVRRVLFRSSFVATKAMKEEHKAKKFLYRSTFGTGPSGLGWKGPKMGLNEDPMDVPMPFKMAGNMLNLSIKNPANTHVISFGGKLLALFEAGLPYAIDSTTLETIGEDDMKGSLPRNRLPVKMKSAVPSRFLPSFIGGAAHTAHPKVCPRTGHLVGWHWSQDVNENSLEVTFTEWSHRSFTQVCKSTFQIPNCVLPPHDMAITENCILLQVNAMKMNRFQFMSGMKGPAASLELDGQSPVFLHVFPRPSAKKQFKPYMVEAPPTFSIHSSHAYEDPVTGNIVTVFSGWPPSESKDFLGSWGGFAPNFADIPATLLWKLELDPQTKKLVDLDVAPGSWNVCAEHPAVHPEFVTRQAKNVYAVGSNVVGDSTPPAGYVKLRVEDGSTSMLPMGEKNSEVDAYWFGTRYFAGEPIIVPKTGGDTSNEDEAYLLGMVRDSVCHREGLAVFDLERDLKKGPVCMMWLKSGVPHGLHGCFAPGGGGEPSIF